MLPQSDFDDSTSNPVQCDLGNGRVVKWAAMALEAVKAELGVPANWHDLDTGPKSDVIVAASRRAEVWPNNSHPRELLVQLAAEVARGMVVAGGQHGEPGVSPKRRRKVKVKVEVVGEGGDEGIPRGKRMKVVEAGTGEKEGDGCSGCLPKVDG